MITTDPYAFASNFVSAPCDLPIVANDTNCWLRREAIANDASPCQELSLSKLWLELASGKCTVVDGFFSKTRGYVVTKLGETRAMAAMDRRCRMILEPILHGFAQKNVAFDLRLTPSAVALNARRGLDSIGLGCKPSRVHPLLLLAVGATREQDESVTGQLSSVIRADEAFRVVSIARPERCLLPLLPAAEFDIVRCLVEGYSHVGMARLRGTSTRTIANQIASVFRRLSVTCRIELIHRLFALSRRSGLLVAERSWA